MSKRKPKKPRNPEARELKENGPREQTIKDKRNKLREQEAIEEMRDWQEGW